MADRKKKRRTVIEETLGPLAGLGELVGGFLTGQFTAETKAKQRLAQIEQQRQLEELRKIPLEDEGVTRPQRLPQDNGRTGMPAQAGVGGPTPPGTPSKPMLQGEASAAELGAASFPRSGMGGAFEPKAPTAAAPSLDLNEIVQPTDTASALRASVPPPDLVNLKRATEGPYMGSVVDERGEPVSDTSVLTRFAQWEFAKERADSFLAKDDTTRAFWEAEGKLRTDIATDSLKLEQERSNWQKANAEGDLKESNRHAVVMEGLERELNERKKLESVFNILSLIMANRGMLQAAKDSGLIGQLGTMFGVDFSNLVFPTTLGTIARPKQATL